jgi:hypothetical protein
MEAGVRWTYLALIVCLALREGQIATLGRARSFTKIALVRGDFHEVSTQLEAALGLALRGTAWTFRTALLAGIAVVCVAATCGRNDETLRVCGAAWVAARLN